MLSWLATMMVGRTVELAATRQTEVEFERESDGIMNTRKTTTRQCAVCGRTLPLRETVPVAVIRDSIRDIVKNDHPQLGLGDFICIEDLKRYRSRHVEGLLQSERRELTALEQEVVRSLREHELLSKDVEGQFEGTRTLGERMADGLADFGGSWSFLILFMVVLGMWILLNAVLLVRRPFDPYPFILLNLVLSCIAAVQAPVIMMSQKRQEAKDRMRSQYDYKVNLKAELEIRQLHEKLDHLLTHQWERLLEVQEVQLELLEELGGRRGD
jgi:uncharacterized membrane protein